MEKTNKFSNLIEYIEKCNNNFKQKIILNDTWDKLINRSIRIFEIKNFSEFAFWIIQTILLFFLFSSFFCKIENWSIRYLNRLINFPIYKFLNFNDKSNFSKNKRYTFTNFMQMICTVLIYSWELFDQFWRSK